jgi:hypothetical protein
MMIAATRVRAAPMPILALRDSPRNGFRGGLRPGLGEVVASRVDRIAAPVEPSQRAGPAILFHFEL